MVNHNRAALNRILRERRAKELSTRVIYDPVEPTQEELARAKAEDMDIAARRAEIPLH